MDDDVRKHKTSTDHYRLFLNVYLNAVITKAVFISLFMEWSGMNRDLCYANDEEYMMALVGNWWHK